MRPLPLCDKEAIIRGPARFLRENPVLTALVILVTVAVSIAGAQLSSTLDITSISPASGQTISGKVPWRVSTSGSVDHVDFLIDGTTLWTERTAPYMFNSDPDGTLDTSTLSDGPHDLQAIAYDSDGKTVSETSKVIVANAATAPVATTSPGTTTTPAPTTTTTAPATTSGSDALQVSIVQPSNGQTLSGDDVVWTAKTSGARAVKITFSIDGQVRWTEMTSPYYFNGDPDGRLDTTGLTDGVHTLTATAYASDGSVSTAAVSVTVANGSTGNPATDGGSSGSTSTGGSGSTAPAAGSGSTAPAAGSGSTAPAAGSVSTTPLLGVPVASIKQPSYGQILSGNVTWIATASGSGVAKMTFAVDGQERWTEYFAPYYFNGDPSGTLDTTGLTDGAHTLTVTAYAASGRFTSASISVTVANTSQGGELVSPGAQVTSGFGGPAWPSTSEPAYRPTRVANTVSEFNSIIGSLRAGDVVEVKPMTVAGEVVFGAKPAGVVEIHFDAGVRFTGASAGSSLPGVWIHGSNLRLYGGEVSNLGNDCVRIQAASADSSGVTNVRWWGVKIHDCAATGLNVQGTSYANSGLDFAAEIWSAGENLGLDPHAEKGTGLHGAYLGGGTTVSSGRFLLDIHDQPTGAAVQVGDHLQNSELWIQAHRITFAASSQVGGNAVQFWGSDNRNVTIRGIEADTLAGRVVETDALDGGSGLVVQYARGTNTRLSPYALGSYVSCLSCG